MIIESDIVSDRHDKDYVQREMSRILLKVNSNIRNKSLKAMGRAGIISKIKRGSVLINIKK